MLATHKNNRNKERNTITRKIKANLIRSFFFFLSAHLSELSEMFGNTDLDIPVLVGLFGIYM